MVPQHLFYIPVDVFIRFILVGLANMQIHIGGFYEAGTGLRVLFMA